jgi:glucosamine-6-phosphate deaminase
MKIIKEKTYEGISSQAATIIINEINSKPNLVLGLPTGSTPLGMYQELIKAYQSGLVSFSQVTTFNLDEYYGLSRENSNSYWFFMWENFFKHIDIKPEKVFIPRGDIPKDKVEDFCSQYEKNIKAVGGIDIQVLGIGHNGHIAFNEPGSSFDSRTRMVDLSLDTIEVNSRFFDIKSDQPKTAITMGLGTIMEANKIILIASGENKAKAISDLIKGEATQDSPASVLRRHHDVTIFIDESAGVLL